MQRVDLFVTIVVCLSGSGGIVLWALNRIAKRRDDKNTILKEIQGLNITLMQLKKALVLALENDKIIFKALRTHQINGESEEQERKMDKYFLSLINKKGDGR